MPSLSFIGGVDAKYEVVAGKTTVTLNSRSPVKHRAVYAGTGQMVFHWVQEGKTQAWRCDVSMGDAAEVQAVESAGADGSQILQVGLDEVFPAGLILQGRMEGTLVAPAVHVDVPWGGDVWMFLIKSPWFPLRLLLDKPSLVVEHGLGRVTASLEAVAGGSLGGQLSIGETGFKKATLMLRRKLGSYTSTETICEASSGSQELAWRPIARSFDLLLVTGGSISESKLVEIAEGLGADISPGLFEAGSVRGDYVLCDGPATAYSLVLRGHRGILENQDDQMGARLTW